MSTYWDQFNHDEIMSMYGVETELDSSDFEIVYDARSLREKHDCSGCCMYCLGLSWRDFL